MENYQESLNEMIKLKPDWILITSLFYNGPVEAKIQITDHSRSVGSDNFRKSFYNIYSLDEIKKYIEKKKYTLDKVEPFKFPFELTMPINKGMGTYTEKLDNGELIQMSGPLRMPWYTLLFKADTVSVYK